MIKMIVWVDDGREEITTLTATADGRIEEQPSARPFSWELLHQQFVARLREKEKEG